MGVTTHRGLYNVSFMHPHVIAGWVRLYPYTADLMCLELCGIGHTPPHPALSAVTTPLRVQVWQQVLLHHPDRAFAQYICKGLEQGFRVGFQRGSPLKSAQANLGSASEHPEAIEDFVTKECTRGRMLGPFTTTEGLPPLQVNRIGAVPKGHDTGKWRIITDLSFPKAGSVNDGIDPSLCSLSYTTVDEIARRVAELGQGTLLAKVDIESAYRLLPVHPQDRPLQAIRWKEGVYIDVMLPFGLRSAAKIFNAVADALNWHLRRMGVEFVDHYLDDYIILGAPGSDQCQTSLEVVERECRRLGVPLAVHKREGPATCLTFLGIQVDTVAGQLTLPRDKLGRLQELLQSWADRKCATRRELESLVGHLNHACKVVRSGRSFLRRILNLLHGVKLPAHSSSRIRLSHGFRSDLAWWLEFVAKWNGVSFLAPPTHLPQLEVTSDASGSWGCGAWHEASWFQCEWGPQAGHLTIAGKELIPVILACDTWGKTWKDRRIHCYCDNQVVVACMRSRTSKDDGLMHLLRCLTFVEAQHQCHLHPVYIDTRANHLADDLSRNNAASFLSKVPGASREPSRVSRNLLNLLLDPQADWTSPTWRHQFGLTSRQV